MNIAIVGATGNVGRKTLEILERKEFSIDNLYLVASSKSVGKKIGFRGKEMDVLDLENFDFSKVLNQNGLRVPNPKMEKVVGLT